MKKERILTSSEAGMYLLNEYSGCFSIATISHLRGEINTNKLQKSIALIQDKHLILNCKIIKEGNDLKFKLKESHQEKVTLEIIENYYNKSWEKLVIEYFNQPLPLERYLFRCLLILPFSKNQETYFITIICHSIADGLSSVKLHNLIFQEYEQLSQNNETIPWQYIPEITSIYEKRLGKPFQKYWGYLRGILSVIKLQIESKCYKIQKIKPETIIPLEHRKGHFINYCLEQETIEKIIIKSKQENITVNSLLTAAVLLAIADEVSRKNKEKVTLYCQCYVDLRKRLNPMVSDEWLEVMISSLMSFYTLTSQSCLLSLAKEVNNKVKKELQTRDFMYFPLLLKPVIKTSINNSQKFTPTVGISNLGKIYFKRNYGNFTLENIGFVPNISIYDHTLSLSISTFHNKMNINFAFSYPSFSYEKIDKIAQHIINIIRE